MTFLWASPSSQGLPEHSYFGHRKGFWRSNSISVQLRIRKQKELIRKRREIDFTSRELSRNFITAVTCLLSSSLTFYLLTYYKKFEIFETMKLARAGDWTHDLPVLSWTLYHMSYWGLVMTHRKSWSLYTTFVDFEKQFKNSGGGGTSGSSTLL